jgi:hypothetical protein
MEPAKRGVSAFLQDCETVQNSGVAYTIAGQSIPTTGANDFQPVRRTGLRFDQSGTGFSGPRSTLRRFRQ